MQRAAAEVKIKKNLTLVKAIHTLETLQMASVYFGRKLNSRELSLRRDGVVGGRIGTLIPLFDTIERLGPWFRNLVWIARQCIEHTQQERSNYWPKLSLERQKELLERNKRLTARRKLAKERGEKLESFPRRSSLSPMQMIEDEWWRRKDLINQMPVITGPGFGRRVA
jgi:hypothetical protein